jgi:hypothetical protein
MSSAHKLKDGEFSFRIGGTPSTAGKGSKTPVITPAAASALRTQRKSTSRRASQPRGGSSARQQRENSGLASRSKSARSSSRAMVTPAQRSTKRKRTEQLESNVDELSEMILTASGSTSSKRLKSGNWAPIREDIEEDELAQESPEHDSFALNGSAERRRSGGSENTPAQEASASRSSTVRRATTSRSRVPLADIDENSVAFITPNDNDVVSEDEIASLEPTPIIKLKAKPNSKRSSTARRVTYSAVNSVPEQHEDSMEVDEEDEITVMEDTRSRSVSITRVQNSRTSIQPRTLAKVARKKRAAKLPRSKNGEPVTMVAIRVYRPSKKPRAESDPLGAVPIPAFNSIDVLAQCFSEICNAAIEKEANKEGASKRKILAMANFKEAIRDSLLDLSAAQNTVYALTGRLRQVKRQQAEARAELMGLKKRREEISMRMDSVRSHHLKRTKEENEKRTLAHDLKDLKEANRKYRELAEDAEAEDEEEEDQQERFQDLLLDVKALVHNGGILETVRNWNATMEAALNRS